MVVPGGHGLLVSAKHATVSCREPLFAVLLRSPDDSSYASLAVVCALCSSGCMCRAPQRATEAAVLSAWWCETHSFVRAHARDHPNAAIGSLQSAYFGDCGAEQDCTEQKKDGPGEALHAIREFDVCLPITEDPVHTAAHHTYAQKRGTRLCRPDFLGVPFPTTMLPG